VFIFLSLFRHRAPWASGACAVTLDEPSQIRHQLATKFCIDLKMSAEKASQIGKICADMLT
jgi:hypothetical protein